MRPGLLRLALGVLLLALGIALGAGPLQHSNSQRDRELASQKAELSRRQHRIASLEAAVSFANTFGTAAGPALTKGVLAGRSVTVVTLPGADPATVAKLRAAVEAAQGKVTGEVDLAAPMARASSRQLVEALTSQMLTQAPDVSVPADASGYQRFGALLARAIGTGPSGQPAQAAYDATAVGIMSGLQSASLATASQAITARAGLALVVTGPEAATTAAAADNAVPVTILQALGQQLPTVVVGPTGAAGERGVIGSLRGSPAATKVLSTVDSSETTIGQVAGVLALAARAGGTIGQYGAVHAADGPIPGAPAPAKP